MSKERKFFKWDLKGKDLEDLSPLSVRDLIIKCFYTAQQDNFRITKKRLGTKSTDEEVYKSVVATVRNIFKEAGKDFENPTKQDLAVVLVLLAKKARLWGTPRDVITHHIGQLQKVIDMLE